MFRRYEVRRVTIDQLNGRRIGARRLFIYYSLWCLILDDKPMCRFFSDVAYAGSNWLTYKIPEQIHCGSKHSNIFAINTSPTWSLCVKLNWCWHRQVNATSIRLRLDLIKLWLRFSERYSFKSSKELMTRDRMQHVFGEVWEFHSINYMIGIMYG